MAPSSKRRASASVKEQEEEEGLDVPAPGTSIVRVDDASASAKRRKTATDLVRVDAQGVRRLSTLDAPIMLCEGHAAQVTSVKFSPDGSSFASASFDKQIFLWNVRGDCQNFAVLKGHKNAVLELHWTTDGSYLVSASPDKTVRVWDVERELQVKKWDEHQSFVNSCCPARRGTPLFVSGSDDGTAKLWDQRRKRSIHTLQEKYQVGALLCSALSLSLSLSLSHTHTHKRNEEMKKGIFN